MKMVEWKAFLAKEKHQNHISQWDECVCAQSQKVRRLPLESKFIPYDGGTLVLRIMVGRKANQSFNTNKENVFIVPN